MYLEKLNDKLRQYLQTPFKITNTAKLNVQVQMYMLEFAYGSMHYHLYHILGESIYELRLLDEAYRKVTFDELLTLTEDAASSIVKALDDFMKENFDGIQTTVDCQEGLEETKKAIRKIRLDLLA